MVHSVRAAADGSRLVVHVVPTDLADFSELEQLMSALDHARPWLRRQVASEINRKRVPDIAFQILLNPEVDSQS
jgi:ribosome-binding factor A